MSSLRLKEALPAEINIKPDVAEGCWRSPSSLAPCRCKNANLMNQKIHQLCVSSSSSFVIAIAAAVVISWLCLWWFVGKGLGEKMSLEEALSREALLLTQAYARLFNHREDTIAVGTPPRAYIHHNQTRSLSNQNWLQLSSYQRLRKRLASYYLVV